MADTRILKVAVPVPLPGLFDYLAPAGVDVPELRPGCRLRVPFGHKRLIGVLVEVTERSAVSRSRLKAADCILDEAPIIGEPLMGLLLWAARYYYHPVGEVFAAALPKLLRRGQPGLRSEARWHVTEEGKDTDLDALRRRAPRQAALLEALLTAGQGIRPDELAHCGGDWRGALRALAGKGLCERKDSALAIAPAAATSAVTAGHRLTAGQSAAVTEIGGSLGRFHAFLLDGVTGSGKTEVYLQAMEQALARTQQALVLVPEIGLTPQLLKRFSRRFAVNMAVLHSGLGDTERLDAWQRAAIGEARLVIGTRSAVFVPLQDPGLIVIDEEHDASFKQQDGFRYSARDLAVARAQRHAIPVVLGSATPSLESLHNADRGRYTRLVLPERPGSATHPDVRVIDLRAHASQQGLSTPLIAAISRHLQAGNQVLLFLNRRGYAPALFCSACGWIAQCDRCDARLTMHMTSKRLRCHHCGREQPLQSSCGHCNETLAPVGQGTERTEETLASLFPDAHIARIDRDTTQKRGAMNSLLDDVRSGRAHILVGTQMLTKGHHFPNVTLVAIVNADQGLFGSDFRSNERFAQTLVQVAGRAGRAEQKGEVLIQTSYPEHPLLQRLINDGYAGFAQAALAERENAQWPPFSHLALLRAEAPRRAAANNFLAAARRLARNAMPGVTRGKPRILGPAPAPMERRAGRYRAHLLIQSGNRDSLHRLLDNWVPQLRGLEEARRVRWSLDVDPIELF